MKRRHFLYNSMRIAVGAALSSSAFAQRPCWPVLNSAVGGGTCVATALSDSAAAIGPGESIGFGANTTQRSTDIQWMTRPLHYDPGRQELQYVGKPASSQSSDWKHYMYSEATGRWSDKGVITSGNGHTWLSALDPGSGDYYFNNGQGSSTIWRYDRAADRWRTFMLPTSNNNIGSLAYHPNLFGSGQPGIYIWTGRAHICYRISDQSVHNVGPTTGSGADGGTTGNIKNGTGDYCASRDSLVCGGKGQATGSNRRPIIEVFAGAGNSTNAEAEGTIVYRGEALILVYGGGGGTQHVKLTAHPTNLSKILFLEGFGSSRYWSSTDGGATWQLEGTHPFEANLSPAHVGHFMIGRISEYGVIMGMSSGSGGGDAMLWKPQA